MTVGDSRGAAWPDGLGATLRTTGAEVSASFGDVTVSVASSEWVPLLAELRDRVGLTYFDWLSAVDEGDGRFTLFCHLYDIASHRHLLARTEASGVRPSVASATPVFRGAAWHERETAEMFGIEFAGHPQLTRLLLSDDFDGYPLRKDFVLTARVSKSWPGAKEPGESGDGSPSRRKMQPPGVPDPSWGPRQDGAGHA